MKKRLISLVLVLALLVPSAFATESKSLAACTVTVSFPTVTYTGEAKTPSVTVKDGSTRLNIQTDYTLSYENNINAGTATIVVTGQGDYEGSTTQTTFTIQPAEQTVSLSASRNDLVAGETLTLSASAQGALSYASSNAAVVSVSESGVVTGVGVGTATVAATAAATQNYKQSSASITFTVTAKRVPALAFSQSACSCADGMTGFVNPLSYSGSGTVSYTSSNPDVATVDAYGQVTAIWQGSTTITAAVPESASEQGAQASYVLTVTGASGAQYGTCGANIQWRLTSDGTLTVRGSGEMQTEAPPDWLDYASEIKSVQLDDTITSIAAGAFAGCTNLVSVSPLSAKLTQLGAGAFAGCTSLLALTVADGNSAFCSTDGCLFTADGKTLLVCPAGKSGEYTVPSGVTAIADEAFSGCDKLTVITLPGGVETVGSRAFYGCKSLRSITLPDGAISVGAEAFLESGITTAVLPESVQTIGESAFPGGTTLYSNSTIVQTYAQQNDLTCLSTSENTNLLTYSIAVVTPTYTYDGSAKCPKVVVTRPNSDVTLTEGTDYTLQYRSNIHAGTATVVVTGCGDYAGSAEERTFVIEKALPTLTFAQSELRGTYGERVTQTVQASTDGEISYHSSDPTVASVDASTGEVGLCGGGTAVITARAAEGRDYLAGSAAYTLTVDRAEQAFGVKSGTDTLEVGKSTKISITDAHGDVTITTEDTDVARVSGNTVTALAVGTVQLTVSAAGDSCYLPAQVSLSLEIIPVQPTDIALSAQAYYLHPGETQQLTTALQPEGVSTAITWQSDDPDVVSVRDGLLTAQSLGEAEITVQTANGKTASCTVHVCALAEDLFSDVFPTNWFYSSVQYVADRELMNGIGGGKFDPNGTMTRAMAVQILYNREGRPEADGTAFADVSENAWYAPAIQWASECGVVAGVGNNRFEPNGLVTREQFAKILYYYAGAPAVSGSLDFSDADKVSGWAKNAMLWATQNGIISGMPDASGNIVLEPGGTATRAQAAKMLRVYLENAES